MKLYDIYENLNNLKFIYNNDEDSVKITLNDGKSNVGFIVITQIFDAYEYEFKDDMSYDEYEELIGNDNIDKIEHLEIYDKFKGKGYGKILTKEAIRYIKKNNGNIIYLNASPMGFSGLELSELVSFYKGFGFEIIPHLDKWDNNKEMIMKL